MNGLYYSKDDECRQHDKPEALARVCCLDNSQDDGRYEAQQLQVGHHVQQSDEHAQTYSHGEVDNQKTNAEQHTYTEGHKTLSAEVFVHALLHVADNLARNAAVAVGEHLYPTSGELFVV